MSTPNAPSGELVLVNRGITVKTVLPPDEWWRAVRAGDEVTLVVREVLEQAARP